MTIQHNARSRPSYYASLNDTTAVVKMYASTRLSVADARAIIGLPAERGATPAADYGSFLGQKTASALDVETRMPIIEPGSTLKSRFAALARNNEASRKETRAQGRSLVGRRANLEERRGHARDSRIASVTEEKSISLPLQRWEHRYIARSTVPTTRACDRTPQPAYPSLSPFTPAFVLPACKGVVIEQDS